jgi:hypothetical protein
VIATPPRAAPRAVVDLAPTRIARALLHRSRYKYVQPRVQRWRGDAAAGTRDGWQIVSPNCSRNVDAAGGDIAIAAFEPEADGRWRLHARDHRRACWRLMDVGLSLDEALARVCTDPLGVYWP